MMKKQGGTVLITVMMMVTIAALIATDIGYRQKMDIKRTGALLARDQALQFLMGAEEIAYFTLVDDLKSDLKDGNDTIKDTLFEDWAEDNDGFPIPGGYIKGKLTDLQSLFNINTLVSNDQTIATKQKERFLRLLATAGVPSDNATTANQLIERLIDWLDQNQEPTGFDGKEDIDYLAFTPAYRAANHIIFDISELMLIEGFTSEDLAKLEPYVCFLPPDEPINLNTIKEEVLATISELNMAVLLEERQKKSPIDNIEGFANLTEVTDIALSSSGTSKKSIDGIQAVDDDASNTGSSTNTGNLTGNFDVKSKYFMLQAEAIINDKLVLMRAVLYRPEVDPTNKNQKVEIKTILRKLEDPLKRV